MKRHWVYTIFIGCLGMLLMCLQLFLLNLELVHPLVLPALLTAAVVFSAAIMTFKLSVGLSRQVLAIRILQTTLLSTVIINLPILLMAGYYLLLRQQHPGLLYRDHAEVAFDVFLFMLKVGLVLSVSLSLVARYVVNRRFSFTLSEKTAG